MNPWPHGDPREVAHQILTDPRFALAAQRPAEKSWLEYLYDALRDLWHKLTDPLNHLTGNPRLTAIIGYAVLVVIALLLGIVIVHVATRFAVRRIPGGARAVPGTAALDSDARTLLARALDAASAGRHHEAAALLWASALRALDEHERVRFDPSRTPGEWRRLVRDASFDAFARDAVDALFGERGADAALVARMRDAYDRVVAPA
jgi:hypothetical protein